MESFMKYIGRIARCGTMYRAAKLEPYGLNGHQHLYIIKICDNPGISQENLAKLIWINKSNVTRQLALLEQGGFIERRTDPSDKRSQLVYPTKRAHAVYPTVRQVLQEWNGRIMEGFDEQEREHFLAMLQKMLDKAEQEVSSL